MDTAQPLDLPRSMTSLVGRERDVAAIVDLLRQDDVRLVTLIGPGGVGKTRLAIAAATALGGDSTDAVCFVPLAPVSESSLVVPAIAQALGIREVGDNAAAAVIGQLRARHLLLILDNVEHLLAAAPAIAVLMSACPGLKLLVTSRSPLRLRGEREYEVRSLALPDATQTLTIAELESVPAVVLFVERARAVRPDFSLTDSNAGAVADVCRYLDGLPLAIELAAARANVLSPAALLTRLDDRLALLAAGPKDAPRRLRTLRDAIAWSHDLLGPSEQRLFRRLAAFAGGWSLESAESVCGNWDGEDEAETVFDGLTALVDQSLVQPAGVTGDEPRFGLLETIRAFGLEQLRGGGEESAARARHAAWCVSLAERAEQLLLGPEQGAWLNRLEGERANLRAAGSWAASHDPELALRLAGALGRFWGVRGHLPDERAWLELALSTDATRLESAPSSVRAKALHMLGNLFYDRSDYEQSRTSYEAAIDHWRRVGNLPGEAAALVNLALVALCRGELESARSYAQAAVTIHDQSGAEVKAAQAKSVLGAVVTRLGDYVQAWALLRESVEVQLHAGDVRMVSYIFNFLGELETMRGDLTRAQRFVEQSLALTREIAERRGIATALIGLGRLALLHDDLSTSAARFAQALSLRWELGDRRGMAEAIDGWACSVIAEQPVRGLRFLAAATTVRDAIGSPAVHLDRAAREHALSVARQALRTDVFQATWAAGQSLPLDQVVADICTQVDAGIALAIDMPAPTPARDSDSIVSKPPRREWPPVPKTSTVSASRGPRTESQQRLSRRERDVLRLIVDGLSDREIAESLVVNERTVSWHVTNIFNKFGVNSRTAAAVRAIRDGYL